MRRDMRRRIRFSKSLICTADVDPHRTRFPVASESVQVGDLGHRNRFDESHTKGTFSVESSILKQAIQLDFFDTPVTETTVTESVADGNLGGWTQ